MKNNPIRMALIVVAIIAFNLVSITSSAQDKLNSKPMKSYLYLQPNVGVTQYFGDINESNFFNKNLKLGFGAVLGYQISPVFGLRSQFLKTNLYGERTDQNRKFESDLWDAALHLTLNVNELFSEYNDKRFFNLYLFGGAGVTSYKSSLESITPSAVTNSHSDRQNEFILPLGAGVSFRISNNLSVNLEYGDHITFQSDNLDFTDGVKKNDHYSYASAGLQIRFGAKDTDRDGVKDKEDVCPEVPGLVELAGCPDKDEDNIADKDDACPDIAGKAEFKGCPDGDGDGIPDKDDACPQAPGKKELGGCPDKDGDGIVDKDDKCPDAAGKKEFNGCPDRDGDGIIDSEDQCPDVKGLANFTGCPDTDSDGIPDNKDNCPEVAGIAANNGCPESLKGAIIKKVVYFNSDEAIVQAQDILDLNEVAAYMNENPDAVVSVAGHTDSRESEEYNLRLSERRADYVIEYLKKKGMTSLKINKSFFGKSKPVADNMTMEGRALNRRVEIHINK
jgi:outer membrane protein OmpA-like peptidoglycan-associated protein/opacity protein-like surface antigen